jgi:uncharacterized protein (DUF1778 family)
MTKTRIQVYADEETRRRIALAAARQNVPITQYCLDAIKQQLAKDFAFRQVELSRKEAG